MSVAPKNHTEKHNTLNANQSKNSLIFFWTNQQAKQPAGKQSDITHQIQPPKPPSQGNLKVKRAKWP